MHEPKIFGLHIFCSISLRLWDLVIVFSSFCPISPCPTAATHTSLSNYMGQQHQIIPTEIILKRTKTTESQGQCLAEGQGLDKCNVNAEKTKGRKMAVSRQARAQLISLEDPNSIKCAISDAAQAERSGLTVILSAQLRMSSCNTNRKHTKYHCW